MLKCNGRCETGQFISRTWVCVHNNLEVNRPNLMLEWHPDNKIPMSHYTVNSGQKVKWLCSNNTCDCHEWRASINNRAKSDKPCGCPFCVNKKLCIHNNLEATHPELITEWHPENRPMSSYPPNSDKKVKWICSHNNTHIWEAVISKRTNKTDPRGCPLCSNSGCSKVQIKWLTEIEDKEGIYIQHFCKEGGEYTVPNAGKVDGYCEETNTVYEFHGTFWHGDPRIYNRDDINPVSKKTFGELYDKTLEKEQKIRDLGYNLVVMWELDYL